MTAGTYNIEVDSNARLVEEFVFKDDSGNVIDLTGYVIEMDVRDNPDSTTEIIQFKSDGTGDGTMNVDEVNGKVTISLTDTQTLSLPTQSYRYDMRFDPPNNEPEEYVLQGNFTINPTITR